MPDNTWGMIDERVTALDKFYKRVRTARNRLKMVGFSLTDPLSNEKLDDVINVTENRSVGTMMRVIAGLMSARWQTVVEGKLSLEQAHKIEDFIGRNEQQGDEYIFDEYGIADLATWLSSHVCHTSLIGVQWMSSIKDGAYKIHCLPLDMLYTPFVHKKWAAPITWLDKADLEEELEKFAGHTSGEFEYHKLGEIKDTDNEIRDYWNTKTNEFWVNNALVFKQQNPFDELPFVFVWAPSGFMFRDKGYLEFESPGLLYQNENLYDQLSRQLSIDATLGFNAIHPSFEYETENPDATVEPRPVGRRGETLEVPKGELHKPVPTADINRAELASRDQVAGLIEQGAPTAPRDYNTPQSGVGIAAEAELLDQLQNPRVIALQRLKEGLARLIITQAIKLRSSSLFIGKTGRQEDFTLSDLKDPKTYTISYQMLRQNKRLAIVNEVRALAAWGKFPRKYIFQDILSVEDPAGWEQALEIQEAKAADPAIGLAEMAIRYAGEAEKIEDETEKKLKNTQSKLLVHDYVMLMRQKMQPAMPTENENLREATKQTGNPQALISLMGQKSMLP